MTPYFIDKLPEYGITNLIEIDGLLYAPVSDLLAFFLKRTVYSAAIVAAAFLIVLGGSWLINKFRNHPPRG